MKKSRLQVKIVLFLLSTSGIARSLSPPNTGGHGIIFTENKGQVHDQHFNPRPDILYGVMAGNMTVHIKSNGVSYQLNRIESWKKNDLGTKYGYDTLINQVNIYRVDLTWLNVSRNVTAKEEGQIPGHNNYYLESCPTGALEVKSCRRVRLNEIYPGIDASYYEKYGELKCDYIVAAGADYQKIKIEVQGAKVDLQEDGSLLLHTPLGNIREGAPAVYQNTRELTARWHVVKEGVRTILSFEVDDYDPRHELIIDPVTRLWGTYYGGNSTDYANHCATDSSGNVYITGYTNLATSTIMATSGTHQVFFGGSADAFLAKFNSNGVRLWGTYYGGSGAESGNSCAVEPSGNVYLAGSSTTSLGVAVATPGSHQSKFGGYSDAFLAKFTTNGIRLWGTYYGGDGAEGALSCATDNFGNVYITGNTTGSANTVIATPGSHQPTFAGGSYMGNSNEGFLAKFNSSGVRQWGTFYGGTGIEECHGVTTDLYGNVYIAGTTGGSGTAIATTGSHQSFPGGNYDGFLAKFNTNGIRLWGTYYGGLGDDGARACVTDASGNVYLAGSTQNSTGTVIATVGSHQATPAGDWESYLVKFSGTGTRLWSTFYGGSAKDIGYSCITDTARHVYLAGYTNSSSDIATASGHQTAPGGSFDYFLVQLDSSGVRQWGTYYGGLADEVHFNACATHGTALYLAGSTKSAGGTAITTVNSHQSAYGGSQDAFLVKFDICTMPPQPPLPVSGDSVLCSGSGQVTYSIPAVSGASGYIWIFPPSWLGSGDSHTIAATPGASGIMTVVATNPCGSSAAQTMSVTVNALPAIIISSLDTIICLGEATTLTADGAVNYTFVPGGMATSLAISPTVTTSYTVTGIDQNGCENSATFTQVVDECSYLRSLSKSDKNTMHIFPNPAGESFWIVLYEESRVELINALGQRVYAGLLKEGKHIITADQLRNGLYFVRCEGASGAQSGPVLIKN